MAEGQRMTAGDVVAQVRDGRLEDFVREAVVLVARELMEADVRTRIAKGVNLRPRSAQAPWVLVPSAPSRSARGRP
jgi:hypothetical protein